MILISLPPFGQMLLRIPLPILTVLVAAQQARRYG